MSVEPYLFFNGRCQEALDFYRQAVGAEVLRVMRFKEAPEQPPPGTLPPGSEDKILHASFRIGDATLMASDGMSQGNPEFKGISLSLILDDEAEATRLFNGLAEGGKVAMPLGRTFYSPCFGMVTDRFGVSWMVVTNQS